MNRVHSLFNKVEDDGNNVNKKSYLIEELKKLNPEMNYSGKKYEEIKTEYCISVCPNMLC